MTRILRQWMTRLRSLIQFIFTEQFYPAVFAIVTGFADNISLTHTGDGLRDQGGNWKGFGFPPGGCRSVSLIPTPSLCSSCSYSFATRLLFGPTPSVSAITSGRGTRLTKGSVVSGASPCSAVSQFMYTVHHAQGQRLVAHGTDTAQLATLFR